MDERSHSLPAKAGSHTGNEVLERLLHLNANRTTVRTEAVAGVTTFLAMACIIFVQPAVLSAAGTDSGAVMVATCVPARSPRF
jgi:AGZA family xanthine/uracil permease-like MFS transporter